MKLAHSLNARFPYIHRIQIRQRKPNYQIALKKVMVYAFDAKEKCDELAKYMGLMCIYHYKTIVLIIKLSLCIV